MSYTLSPTAARQIADAIRRMEQTPPRVPFRLPREKFFAIVVDESSEGADDDYADNRHWCVTAYCDNEHELSGSDYAAKWADLLDEQMEQVTFDQWTDTDAQYAVFTATNIASVLHVVPTDGTQVVEVQTIAGKDSETVPRFIFAW